MTHPTLSDSPIEVLRGDFPRGEFRAALFDFDGTLSLIRRNWQAVMIPMMVDVLTDTGTGETSEQLHEHVEEFVMRLNGKQTIYQMIQLADEVRARGGRPLEPLDYKHRYHDLLWQQIGDRVAALKDGRATPEEMTVPGTHRLLAQLQERGLALYLASGTDLKYVRDEVAVLGLEEFFGPHIYGALDDYQNFSKAMIIDRMIGDMGVQGHQLLAFGDGFVEIEETRKAGGVAVGVASDEDTRQGINAWKRARLIRAGADIIIGDYRQRDELLALLGL
ncbi:MAG: HAD family phosphatase [Planctomycetia bacterium]|nr:HAD family phosphatase [Planctomycetia bacterium]